MPYSFSIDSHKSTRRQRANVCTVAQSTLHKACRCVDFCSKSPLFSIHPYKRTRGRTVAMPPLMIVTGATTSRKLVCSSPDELSPPALCCVPPPPPPSPNVSGRFWVEVFPTSRTSLFHTCSGASVTGPPPLPLICQMCVFVCTVRLCVCARSGEDGESCVCLCRL